MALTLDLGSGRVLRPALQNRPRWAPRWGSSCGWAGAWPRSAGSASIVNAVPQGGSIRVGFRFDELPNEDRERVDFVVVDTVLKQFGR